jgi:F-type H+-transporting ATPase subunit b
MGKITQEVQTERQRLLDEARNAADALSTKRHVALINEAHTLNQALSRRTRQEVFAIARKALTDLSASSLEERMAEVFIRLLREMDEQAKKNLGETFKSASAPALLRSAFDLPETQRTAIQNALNETFSADLSTEAGIAIRFETAPELISGIELTANGQKIAWSISDYLAELGKSIDELLKEKDKAKADAQVQAKTESNLATKIGKRAYELYEMQGRKEGQAVQNWDAAEREVRSGVPGSSKVEPIAVTRVEAKPDIETKTKAEPEAATKST